MSWQPCNSNDIKFMKPTSQFTIFGDSYNVHIIKWTLDAVAASGGTQHGQMAETIANLVYFVGDAKHEIDGGVSLQLLDANARKIHKTCETGVA